MVDPIDSPEMREMKPDDKMGDEVAYLAHCINGASYPNTQKLAVKVGDRVRLRILNANPTQTRYVRLAGHRLTVTHTDGNRLDQPLDGRCLAHRGRRAIRRVFRSHQTRRVFVARTLE